MVMEAIGMSKQYPKMMEQVARIASETAVQAALTYLEEEKKKDQEAKRDRRLRNTKLLLRNYRSFVLHCQELKTELDNLEDEEYLDELDKEELAVEAIKRSKKRTLSMVKFIDKMLTVYRILSTSSDRPEELRQYDTIYHMYIAPKKMTLEEIAECHNVVTRTVQRDINEAVKSLTSLIFGVDGIRFID
jgi:hypothetical protein